MRNDKRNGVPLPETAPRSPRPIALAGDERPCASCGAGSLREFYALRDVPVHSCLLLDSADEAQRHPRGDISLGICRACGFISNLQFDEALVKYRPGYEESQHYSPLFHTYAQQLAGRLVSRYGVRGKVVLEIGCGKGDFLNLLCEYGDNAGIGVDPAVDPQRSQSGDSGKIRFVAALFDESFPDAKADVVVCRHTLEHIANGSDLLSLIRRKVAPRRELLVFFEVPDTSRILQEGAFWDVYYEHCSYFTAGSLARLFRACGFEVVDLWRDFHDQYLCIVARVTDRPAQFPTALEESPAEAVQAALDFRRTSSERTAYLKRTIRRAVTSGRRVALWGAGSKCAGLINTLGLADEIGAIVDVNPYKQGKYQPGCRVEIISPDKLARVSPDLVIVMNPAYRIEITQALHVLEIRADVEAL